MLGLEQEGERLHKVMNELETKYKSLKNRSTRFFYMICDHEKQLRFTRDLFKTKKRKVPV